MAQPLFFSNGSFASQLCIGTAERTVGRIRLFSYQQILDPLKGSLCVGGGSICQAVAL